MNIGWDEKKYAINLKNHKVTFEEAASVLNDPLALSALNDHPDGDRFQYIGESVNSRILYVVTVEKNHGEIQIISARKATKNEIKKYQS